MATPQPAPAPPFSPFPRSTLRTVGRQPNSWVTQSPPTATTPTPSPSMTGTGCPNHSDGMLVSCSQPDPQLTCREEEEDSILVMAQRSQFHPIKDNHFQPVRPSHPAKPLHLSHISVLLLKMYIKPQELLHQK